MSARARFNPPSLEWTPELAWLLLRAYGPLDVSVPAGSSRVRVQLGSRTDLLTRIAARHSREIVETELGADAREHLSVLLRQQAARGLAVLETERLVLEIARKTGLSVVWLKFAALGRLGATSVVMRPTADLDVLVEEDAVGQWATHLEASGAVRVSHWVPGYHPAVYHCPADVNVELHVALPYLQVGHAPAPVNLPLLRETGKLRPADASPPQLLMPSRELLVAHLVAHALVQHRYAPAAYPVMRLLSDLVDLGVGAERSLAFEVQELLGAELSIHEVQGLFALVECCAAGTVQSLIGTGSDAERLLRHLLASALDDDYRRQLRLRRLWQVLREEGSFGTVKHLCRALARGRRVPRAKAR